MESKKMTQLAEPTRKKAQNLGEAEDLTWLEAENLTRVTLPQQIEARNWPRATDPIHI